MTPDTEQPAGQNSAMPPAMAPLGDVPLLSSIAATRADLARKIVHACGSTCRQFMA